jgi:iron complex outermembrane receptor protein
VRSAPNPGLFYARTGQLYSSTTGTLDPREATVNRNVNKAGQPASMGFNLGYDLVVPVGMVEAYGFGTFSHRNNDAWLTYRFPDAANNVPEIYPNGYSPHLHISDHDYQVAAGRAQRQGRAAAFRPLHHLWPRSVVLCGNHRAQRLDGPGQPHHLLHRPREKHRVDQQPRPAKGHQPGAGGAAGGRGRRIPRKQLFIGAGEAASYIDGGYKSPAAPRAGVLRTSGSQG